MNNQNQHNWQTTNHKLIEHGLPLEAIKKEARARKQKAPKGYPASFHKWWSPKPVAATQAIILASIMDDPSTEPEAYPTISAQVTERRRRLDLIAKCICWDQGSDTTAINARSELRELIEKGRHDKEILLADPFSGSGAICYGAQKWGINSFASDLNPVAISINRCLLEIPFKATGLRGASKGSILVNERGMCKGIAADIRHYGAMLNDELASEIGQHYTCAGNSDPSKVSAWIWARTIASPNPGFAQHKVPLVSSFVLCNRSGSEAYVLPVVGPDGITYEVKAGKPPSHLASGTKEARGANFRCLLSGDVITPEYVKREGSRGGLDTALMSIVVSEGNKRRHNSPTQVDTDKYRSLSATSSLSLPLGIDPRALWTPAYGLDTFEKLFTKRQLIFFESAANALVAVRAKIEKDFELTYHQSDDCPESSIESSEYADWIQAYLVMALDRCALYGSTLCTWLPKDNALRDAMPRQGLAMSWGFAEGNPFGKSSAGLLNNISVIADCVERFAPNAISQAFQADAASSGDLKEKLASFTQGLNVKPEVIFSTDPPYFDMIGYSDLADYFFFIQKRFLKNSWPDLYATLASPKSDEIFVSPARHSGSKKDAARFFADRISKALQNIYEEASDAFPSTIYYAFKQGDASQNGTSSVTAWEAFLAAVINAGFQITATWLVDTEGTGRMSARDANSIMTSTVLVVRKGRNQNQVLSKRDFLKQVELMLNNEIHELLELGISSVDIRQAALGKGVSIYSSCRMVANVDDTELSICDAIKEIMRVYDEIHNSSSSEWDAETAFAATWFSQNGWSEGRYFEFENLLRSSRTSEDALVSLGIGQAIAGHFKLIKDSAAKFDAESFEKATTWTLLHGILQRLEFGGETAAASALRSLRTSVKASALESGIKSLALYLFDTCEKLKLSSDAMRYNTLVIAWPELERLAVAQTTETAVQASLI